MKPNDLFGVVVRAVGLILVLTSLRQVFIAIVSLVGGGSENAVGLLLFGVPAMLIGIWLVGGAKSLIDFAYPEAD